MFTRCPLCNERINEDIGHSCYSKPQIVVTPEEKWEEEIEDKLKNVTYEGLFFENISIDSLFKKYLNLEIDSDILIKVKIKCKDGCIQIERIK